MAATTSPNATPDAAPLPKMPSSAGFWIGSLLLVVSIVGGAVAVGIGFGHLVSLVAGEYISVPSDSTRTLEPGKYKLYHASSSYDSYDTNPAFTIVGPDGSNVPVTEVGGAAHSTYSTREQTIATFTAPTRGGYQITTAFRPDRPGHAYGSYATVPTTRPRTGTTTPRFETDDFTYPSSVRLAADDSEVAPQTVPWFLGGFLGGFVLFVVGLILLIVTGVRRSRARKARMPPRSFGPPGGAPPWAGYPPPGAYPPPPGPYGGPPPPGPYGGPPPPGGPGPYGGPPPPGPGGPFGGPPAPPPAPGGPGPYGGPPPSTGGFGPPR